MVNNILGNLKFMIKEHWNSLKLFKVQRDKNRELELRLLELKSDNKELERVIKELESENNRLATIHNPLSKRLEELWWDELSNPDPVDKLTQEQRRERLGIIDINFPWLEEEVEHLMKNTILHWTHRGTKIEEIEFMKGSLNLGHILLERWKILKSERRGEVEDKKQDEEVKSNPQSAHSSLDLDGILGVINSGSGRSTKE